MDDKAVLLQKIESTRKKMTEIAKQHSFSSNKVVKISRDLDELLNHFYELSN